MESWLMTWDAFERTRDVPSGRRVSPEHAGEFGVIGVLAIDPAPGVDLLDQFGAVVGGAVTSRIRWQHPGGELQAALDGEEGVLGCGVVTPEARLPVAEALPLR